MLDDKTKKILILLHTRYERLDTINREQVLMDLKHLLSDKDPAVLIPEGFNIDSGECSTGVSVTSKVHTYADTNR